MVKLQIKTLNEKMMEKSISKTRFMSLQKKVTQKYRNEIDRHLINKNLEIQMAQNRLATGKNGKQINTTRKEEMIQQLI